MARLIFNIAADYERWITDHVTPNGYDVYSTRMNELICYPRKSTRPLTYGWMQLSDEDSAKLLKKLEGMGVRLYRVDRIEWDAERPVGIKSQQE
jgi:hypothetical protein